MAKPIFPSWEELYREQPVELMPWYRKSLDHDLVKEIKNRKIDSGAFLDLGTGPGTQAANLKKIGFIVTGVDISASAVLKAAEKYPGIEFLQDDITDSKLDKKFDFILDRGCFHVIEPQYRDIYVAKIHSLLNAKGLLFLKCFSILEPGEFGPARFSEDEINRIFKGKFDIEKIEHTEFRGKRKPNPKALFAVLKKKY